ncbi:hypothetical protein ACFLSI_02115 [Bacteroidota bacterium]
MKNFNKESKNELFTVLTFNEMFKVRGGEGGGHDDLPPVIRRNGIRITLPNNNKKIKI